MSTSDVDAGCAKGEECPRVLVADDDEEFREAIAEIIAMEGWSVLQARDGEEALDFALRLRPDVVVLDHRMPTLTGVEVVQRLRAERVRLPVVMISASYELEELAKSVGVLCHLRKPFGLDELSELLVRAIRGECR